MASPVCLTAEDAASTERLKNDFGWACFSITGVDRVAFGLLAFIIINCHMVVLTLIQ